MRKRDLIVSPIFLLFCFLPILSFTQIPAPFQQLIDQGEFSAAQHQMRQKLALDLSIDPIQRLDLLYEVERLERIKKDFTGTSDEVVAFIKQYVPEVNEQDLIQWEQEKSLEVLLIDGQKKYFNWAGPNLFRINKRLKQIKAEKMTPQNPPVYNRLEGVRKIIAQAKREGKKMTCPVRAKVTYTVTVKPGAVPEGKIIRCWLPFPREIPGRQVDIRLVETIPARYIISPREEYLQQTIYLEQPATGDSVTRFQVVFEFTNHAVYQNIDPQQIKPIRLIPELEPFVVERPPHIVFTEELKQLSRQIVRQETNPYLMARNIFRWIHENIPWASAREYSTMTNISDYVFRNRHGDCGMQTIFFITLCRLNGIPARWQSGWCIEPGEEGMHDWGEIYFAPYGWLPVDVTYGLQHSNDESEKWFFLGGMDAFRLIVNDDYSQNLYPAKVHFRSEPIDFQRGELEWEGGNLYFDLWDYNFNVTLLN